MFYIIAGLLLIGFAIYLLIDESGDSIRVRTRIPESKTLEKDPLGLLEKWKK